MKPRLFGQVAVPAAVVSIVLMLVIPLPAVLLDLLLAANIAGSLLILLMSMFVRRPLDFAIFPALLLVATMFRLALNVSSTRLVLLDGYAGKVIDAFGHFVVGGSLIVGLVIFLILTVIQFIVITNGYRGPQPIVALKPGASGDITLKSGETKNEFIAWSQPRGT